MMTSLVGIETIKVPVSANFEAADLVEQHGNFLYRYAMMRVRDEFTAEDLVQETLLAALKSMDKFSHKSTERTWLTSILKHKIVDYFRQSKREELFDFSADEEFFQPDGHWKPESAPTMWNVSPDKMVENREFWQIINRCLAMLPKRMAAAFTLREIEGLSSDEVCQILNISPNNLWVMLHRARLQLRHEIQTNFFAVKG